MFAPFLSEQWTTARFIIQNAQLHEVLELRDVFNSCSDLYEYDHTFEAVTASEIQGLVEKSIRGFDDYSKQQTFQLQTIRYKDKENILAYFHTYLGKPSADTAFISMFVVLKKQQHTQLGSEIIAQLFQELKALGYQYVKIRVYLPNVNALRFWIKMGFTTIVQYNAPEDKDDLPNLFLQKNL